MILKFYILIFINYVHIVFNEIKLLELMIL